MLAASDLGMARSFSGACGPVEDFMMRACPEVGRAHDRPMAMPEPAIITRLMHAVARRLYARRLAQTGLIALYLASASYALLLLLARLSGLITDLATPATLLIPPCAALAVAVLITGLQRSAPPAAVARLIDQRLASEDLLLTACSIRGSAGAYQELVLSRASARLAGVRPQHILPLRPWRGIGTALAMSALLAFGVLYLPRLDPFGHDAERKKLAARQQQIAEQQKIARTRIETIAQLHSDKPTSDQVAHELAKLTAALAALKSGQKEANGKALSAAQQALGKAFTQTAEPRFSPTDDERSELQHLGAGDLAQSEALKQELAKGSTRAADEKVDQLKALAEKLATTTDAKEQQRLRAQLKQGVESLAKGLGKQGSQALQQALDQLAQSGNPGLSKEALAAVKDSLDLTKAELSLMAQGTRDREQLKDALQTLQMARKLNELGDLGTTDNGEPQDGKSLAEYKKMYAKLMHGHSLSGQPGEGGTGMGPDPNHGQGGKAKENDSATTLFEPERSRSQLGAGVTLMEWKTSGPAAKGVALEQYQTSLREVQQGVSEALLHEQLPPGYQDAVKKYFDSLAPSEVASPAK